MNKIILILTLLFSNFISSQEISCDDLLNFVVKNGYKKNEFSNYTLNSDWLYNISAYEYKYVIYVVAEIKENKYDHKTKKYIFCDIPNQNWNYFKNGELFENLTYGERFHKYIMNYSCNCY